jgi:mannose-6-phosphate isomerase-like protein (cupin superfamily)
MRRVITGVDADGQSVVLSDSADTTVWHLSSPKVEIKDGVSVVSSPISPVAAMPAEAAPGDQIISLLWRSSQGVPSLPFIDEAGAQTEFEMEPPGDGFFWRYHAWGPGCDASAMHTTETLDLLFVLEGEVELILDQESVVLKAGDSVSIPAASHGWRTGPGCRMLQMMQRIEG